MKVDLGIWDKLTRLVIVLIFAAGALAVAFWYLPLIQRNEAMRKSILLLDDQIKDESEQYRRLKSARETIGDPRTVERMARERLGYARTGETVIRFAEPVTNSIPGQR